MKEGLKIKEMVAAFGKKEKDNADKIEDMLTNGLSSLAENLSSIGIMDSLSLLNSENVAALASAATGLMSKLTPAENAKLLVTAKNLRSAAQGSFKMFNGVRKTVKSDMKAKKKVEEEEAAKHDSLKKSVEKIKEPKRDEKKDSDDYTGDDLVKILSNGIDDLSDKDNDK
jgi:hypothetical protein